jgi:PTH1 family peptidyl-tRNA hydrolase
MVKDNILLVGLGNPGSKYDQTRHNIGFMVIDHLKDKLPSNFKLLKPMSYMNLSGQDVVKEANFYKIKPQNIWVIHDDVDIDFQLCRVRFGGSSGGHNGINSIIELLGSDQFWRIRVGIGRPNENMATPDFVLSKFSLEEMQKLPKIIDQVSEIVLESVDELKLTESTYKL